MAIEGKFKKKNEKKPPVVSEKAQPGEGDNTNRPSKIVFGDDGEQKIVPIDYSADAATGKPRQGGKKRMHAKSGRFAGNDNDDDGDGDGDENDDQLAKRWYEHYESYNTTVGEVEDLKDVEITELRNLCRSAFETECWARKKNDPSDAKWLQSALEKGTMRDRANAGALLVQTNPLCHLSALETLIGMVKQSNKGYLDVVEVLTELILKSLMPSYRKLIPIPLRGNDWKKVQKQEFAKGVRETIYATWHFEDQLREQYRTFVTNLTTILHTGQDAGKLKTIAYTARLFMNVPEMERLLLTALVNKLGDPSRVVSAKALYHLQQVVRQHTAMALIVTCEAEKLLFRNNVAASAQHFALAFLASIGSFGDFPTCEKMINICFAYFKILTEKGEINSRTMQSILTCLRKAIANVKQEVNLAEVVQPELLNVIYRMVHIADISIGCQGLSLLLEITEQKGREQDRFYNAVYRKMLDPELASVGPRISSIFFYILHRAMQFDPIPERAMAFMKRLLQVAFYFPPSRLCGALIVISKVLRKRRGMLDGRVPVVEMEESAEKEPDVLNDAAQDDTVKSAKPKSAPARYDAFGRSSEHAGAQFTLKYELSRYLSYFHPTVQKFAQSILDNSALTYYGDPLRDFSLSRFLDRFAFKNPKKPKTVTDENGEERLRPRILGVVQRKADYVPSGYRALPVNSLTKDQCAEDDEYIFQFLEKKRFRIQRAAERKKAKGQNKEEEDDLSDVDSLNDDEFDEYLDRLGVPGSKGEEADVDGEDVDFMQELEQEMAKDRKGKGKEKQSAGRRAAQEAQEAEDEDGLDDWDDVGDDKDYDDADSDEEQMPRIRRDRDGMEGDDGEFSDGGSISLEEDEDFDGSELEEDGSEQDDEDEDEPPSAKKRRKTGGMVSEREFAHKLKTSDMSSLFAAADDFSELLERNVDPLVEDGRSGRKKKGLGAAKSAEKKRFAAHGTDAEVFNQDESSVKQLAWEATRFSDRDSKPFGGGRGRSHFQNRGGRGGSRGMKGGRGRGRGGSVGKKFGGAGRPMGRK
ncbi:CCAAT/enhancer-binding protein zeta [Anopheles nili]|uniref:CCAAT/enhancer-binding protein zeta n=1 Tax=Anopheles nili TaxID=185578 RepID=UPI00237A22A3|nr:CCAAT/enhancer-binding protein zeta [Anopheles nili]